jgi:expansin (peptidoglycan-binding protein)
MKTFTLLLSLAGALFTFSSATQAAMMQENYGLVGVNFLTGNPVNAPVTAFHNGLGTLTSIAISYEASAVLLEGNAISSRISIFDPAGALLDSIAFPNMTGRAQQVEMGSFNVPATDLLDFESAGAVDLNLTPFTACHGSASTPTGCNEFTSAVSGQVTYDFTPVAAPEPAAPALVATGLIAFGLWRRRFVRKIEV